MKPEKKWQKTDPTLRSHPTFLDLVAELDSTPILVDGLLSGLWRMAFTDAPDGDISRFKPRALARAVGWMGDCDVMLHALTDTGFLCEDDGRLVIHDWADWGGALFAERAANANRVSKHRAGSNVMLPAVTLPLLSRVDLDLEELKPPTPFEPLTIEARTSLPDWKPRQDDDAFFATLRRRFPPAQISATIAKLAIYQAASTEAKRYKDMRKALGNWMKREEPEVATGNSPLCPQCEAELAWDGDGTDNKHCPVCGWRRGS